MFKNIFVPFDGSNCSFHALKIALKMAQKYDSKLRVYTCIDKPLFTGGWIRDHRFIDAIAKIQKKEALKDFVQVQKLAKKARVDVKMGILESAFVVKRLVTFAKFKKIDLIVMGTHGRTRWDKFILGSVADGITQKVNCPVLLIR